MSLLCYRCCFGCFMLALCYCLDVDFGGLAGGGWLLIVCWFSL